MKNKCFKYNKSSKFFLYFAVQTSIENMLLGDPWHKEIIRDDGVIVSHKIYMLSFSVFIIVITTDLKGI